MSLDRVIRSQLGSLHCSYCKGIIPKKSEYTVIMSNSGEPLYALHHDKGGCLALFMKEMVKTLGGGYTCFVDRDGSAGAQLYISTRDDFSFST